MKKMMMVFVVLFAMVGSSFGEWPANAWKINSPEWIANARIVKSVYIENSANDWAFVAVVSDTERYVFRDTNEPALKAKLSLILNAVNNESLVLFNRTFQDNETWNVANFIIKKK